MDSAAEFQRIGTVGTGNLREAWLYPATWLLRDWRLKTWLTNNWDFECWTIFLNFSKWKFKFKVKAYCDRILGRQTESAILVVDNSQFIGTFYQIQSISYIDSDFAMDTAIYAPFEQLALSSPALHQAVFRILHLEVKRRF